MNDDDGKQNTKNRERKRVEESLNRKKKKHAENSK